MLKKKKITFVALTKCCFAFDYSISVPENCTSLSLLNAHLKSFIVNRQLNGGTV